jgi:hypothetical protein
MSWPLTAVQVVAHRQVGGGDLVVARTKLEFGGARRRLGHRAQVAAGRRR